jgi:hypothetical protein
VSAREWVLSPLDCTAHLLLPGGQHPLEVLKAWCGHLLPHGVARFERPPTQRHCRVCTAVPLFRAKQVGRDLWPAQCRARLRHFVTPAQVRFAQRTGGCQAVCGWRIDATGLLVVRDAKQVCSLCVAVIAKSQV